jgi:hypothetical protein
MRDEVKPVRIEKIDEKLLKLRNWEKIRVLFRRKGERKLRKRNGKKKAIAFLTVGGKESGT